MASEATKIPFVEGSAPSTPAANRVVMYAKADGLMYSKDDAGAETLMSSGGSGAVATDAIWDAAGDLAIGTGANTAAKLTKGAAATALIAGASTVSWVDILPWHIMVLPQIWTPDANAQGTWANTTNGATDSGLGYPLYVPGSTGNSGGHGMFQNSTGAQNDAIAWDVVFGAGTWDAHFWVRKSTNTGIITLQQDGSDMGTVDTYAAAAAAAKVSITGWSVSTTGKKRMNVKMATKNASSSNYFLGLLAIEFRRTA